MRGLALVACLSMTGCSFIFTSKPPVNHRQLPYFDCSSGRVAPIVDAILTGLQVLGAVNIASKSDAEFNAEFTPEGEDKPVISQNTSIGLNIGFAALFGASAYYGFTKTAECREAKNELILRSANGQAPGPGYGTWPPQGGPGPAPAPGPYTPAPAPAPTPYVPAPAPAPAPAPEPAPAPAPAPY